MQVHRIGIVVGDIDRAKRVYEEIFGFGVALRKMVGRPCSFIQRILDVLLEPATEAACPLPSW